MLEISRVEQIKEIPVESVELCKFVAQVFINCTDNNVEEALELDLLAGGIGAVMLYDDTVDYTNLGIEALYDHQELLDLDPEYVQWAILDGKHYLIVYAVLSADYALSLILPVKLDQIDKRTMHYIQDNYDNLTYVFLGMENVQQVLNSLED